MEEICLTILVFLSGSIAQHHVGAASPLIYIVPSPDDPCPVAENSTVTEDAVSEACLTLQQYFSKEFTYGESVTVSNEINLQLLPGTHFLWMELSGFVFNQSSFIMKSDNATLICNHTSVQEKGFAFAYVQSIEVNGIQFVDCGHISFLEVQVLRIENVIILNLHSWSISSVANATITRTSFLNGFALQVTSSSLLVKLSRFINSTTRRDCTDGGAIYFDGGFSYTGRSNSVLIVEQSIFKNNSAAGKNCSASTGGRGGAIFTHGSRVRISSSDFIGNRAALLGGAFTAEGGSQSVEIFNSSFISNSVGMYGGALYYRSSFISGNIIIKDCDFNNNKAVMKGGALYLNASTWSNMNIWLLMSNFCHNAVSGESGEGGAAYIISSIRSNRLSTVSILNSTFAHNSAPGNAGALYAYVNNLLVQGSFFKNNRAERNGGVIHVNTTSPITISVNQSTFSSNQAGEDGGVIFVKLNEKIVGWRLSKQSVVNISDSNFTHNIAIRSGGIMTMTRSQLHITKGAQICCSNTANLGGVIKACDSEVAIQKDLLIRDDPTDSQCILYDSLHSITKTKSTTTMSYPQMLDSASKHQILIAALTGITAVLSGLVLILSSIIACIILYWNKRGTKSEVNSAHVYVPMNETENT